MSVNPYSSKSRDAGRSVTRRLFQESDIGNTSSNLSIEVSEFAHLTNVPCSVLDGIWQKAHELVVDSDAITCASGYDKAYMVKSFSGKRPHLVIAKTNGQYSCDGDCGNSKSLGLCSHSVAAAEVNGDLHALLEWYIKAKK